MKKTTAKLCRKIASIALVLMMACVSTAFCAISAKANSGIIPMPDVPFVTEPHNTIEEIGITISEFENMFPETIDITHENGRVYVKDIGAGNMGYNNGKVFVSEMELVDGFWTAETEEGPYDYEFVYVDYTKEKTGKGWEVVYSDGFLDPYMTFKDYDNNITCQINVTTSYVCYMYQINDRLIYDEYKNGVFDQHRVSSGASEEYSLEVVYNADRSLHYILFYFYNGDGYQYYFSDRGWSSRWDRYVPTNPPTGYGEEIDVSIYTAAAPAVCLEHPSWENSACTLCGYVCSHENGIDTTTGGCVYCGEDLATAKLTLADGTTGYYLTLEQAISQARGNADSVITLLADCTPVERSWFEIEDGEFYIDLNGFDILTRTNTSIFMSDATLTIFDDSEVPGQLMQMLHMTQGSHCIINGGVYEHIQMRENTKLEFQNGTVTGKILLAYPGSTTLKLSGGQFNEIYAAGTYDFSNALSQGHFFFGENGKILKAEDMLSSNVLTQVTVGTHTDADHRGGEANCTHGAICEICDEEYTATNPDNHKWDEGTVTTDPNCTEPGVKTFVCEHNSEHTRTEAVDPVAENHKWDEGTVTTEPNCTEPGVKTFVCEHNSEHTRTEAVDPVAENHKWDEGTVTTEPNCTVPGTKTFVCEHNSTHTRTEPVDIVADAHKWDNGTVTTPPTCTDKGEKTLVCEHNVQHTKTEEIDSLGGHKYDHACDPDCNECGTTRTPAAHYSENADGKCDECGESFKLSGGAIAGIATGSTVAAGAGGFSLFWFVIKKKKWSDLFVK